MWKQTPNSGHIARMEELATRRRRLGISRKYIALALGIDPSNISHYEKGDVYFSDHLLNRYESALRAHVATIRKLAAEWGY